MRLAWVKFCLIIAFGFAALIFSNCGWYVHRGVHCRFSSEDDIRIAVLDFEQEGMLGGEKLGSFAADELTAALFLQGRVGVIDRAQVRAAMLAGNFTTIYLSATEVQKLGELLKADYLILGKITSVGQQNFLSNNEVNFRLRVICRVLAVSDGRVMGVVQYQKKCKNNIREVVNEVIVDMATAIKLHAR